METFESISKGSVSLFKTPSREAVHIEEVKLVEGAQGSEWRIAGSSGVALVVCGTGPTMRGSEDSDRLHAWGYLREA
jgi:hypothetical protein